jgi:signal peptidase I
VIFALSRYIFTIFGLKLFIFIVICTHLLSSLYVVRLYYTQKQTLQWRNFFYSIVFLVCGVTIFLTGFVLKNGLLGVHIYFVPSISMQPTLEPGDFILIDTWSYKNRKPKINDIVIFTTETFQGVLVKRIQPWPTQQSNAEKYYVMGDNRSESQDSRKFGGISLTQIKGQVKIILFSINPNLIPKPNRIVIEPLPLTPTKN